MPARPQGLRPDAARRERVLALLEPVVAQSGLVLEDVELRSIGRRLVVRVLVDNERGVSLDEVAVASQAVSEALDHVDALGAGPYTLEVSSPGIDRPLTVPRHWRRSVGRLVSVTLADGQQVTGRVTQVPDDDHVELELDVKGRRSRRVLDLAEVRRAVVEVEFSRAVLDGGVTDRPGEGLDTAERTDEDEPVDEHSSTDHSEEED
jgi:ribosome maturation factor RimP